LASFLRERTLLPVIAYALYLHLSVLDLRRVVGLVIKFLFKVLNARVDRFLILFSGGFMTSKRFLEV